MSFATFSGSAGRAPAGARPWRGMLGAVSIVAVVGGFGGGLSTAHGAGSPEGWVQIEYVHPEAWVCVATEPCVDCVNTGDEGTELRVRHGDGRVRAHLVAPGARVRICAGGGI